MQYIKRAEQGAEFKSGEHGNRFTSEREKSKSVPNARPKSVTNAKSKPVKNEANERKNEKQRAI